MEYEELKETLVELTENDELTVTEIKSILTYIQGNGYIT